MTAELGLGIGGPAVTTAASDIGQAVTALAAGASCGWAAKRSSARLRVAWTLLAASATAWGVAQVVRSVFEVHLGEQVPFTSPANIGYVAAVPLAVAGVLAFPPARDGSTPLGRAVLDGAALALSLLFISWAAGFGQIYHQSHASLLARSIGLAYPVSDFVVLSVLIVVYRRSTRSQRGRLMWLICGLGSNAFSDSGFAFQTASGVPWNPSQLLNCGWILGFGLIALAPLWPPRPFDPVRQEGRTTLWRMMQPWLGLVPMVATTAALVATNRAPDPFLVFPGVALFALLMTSQLLVFKDSGAAAAKLQERETMLNEVIDHAPQGVARVTRDGTISNANPKLASILSLPVEAVPGCSLTKFIAQSAIELAFNSFSDSDRHPNDTYESNCRATRADGTHVWLRWSMTPIRNPDASIGYFIAMFEDVTAKREAEETARANLEQLEKLNQLKSDFVSAVSHEFRSALTGIQGFSELISDYETDPAEMKHMAREITDEAMRLNRMITRMLDLDRLEAGQVRLELQPIDINDLIQAAAERFRASTDRHVIAVTLQTDLPNVMADADLIAEVLSNLLSNAIKYSPNDREIAVQTWSVGHSVAVKVSDHGVGIPPEFINRIFGRFERYENKSGGGKILGTGLGLAITRQIVEMHGGRIRVKSAVGSGSDFEFTIPIA
jgi:two-component system sensor histidine kinase/response regulator